jgi:hypothetical protein
MPLHVATRKGLFVYDLSGPQPRITGRHFLGMNVSLTLVDPRSGRWYAALDHGHFGVKLHGSSDQGATWSELAVPVYPKKPEDAPLAADGRPQVWDLKRIWSLESGGPDEPGRLWCGTIPGGLFRSDDHGASWSLVEALWHHPSRLKWFGGGADYPGIHSICVDPRDPRTIRLAISCGGAWRSDDSGATWRNTSRGMFAAFMPPEGRENPDIQDPHRMVQCREQPDHLWIQHHNGVFRSTDGGELWQHVPHIPPSDLGFGFPVAVHPQRGDTAWLVPAIKDEVRYPVDGKVVVVRTDNGGASWRELRTGLPQADAYDLVWRHGLDVSADGNSLAFGSTTGGLWASHDGGEQWHLLNAHLPPVHAVRWFGAD